MGKAGFIFGIIFLHLLLILIPLIILYGKIMAWCLLEYGPWCNYGIPGWMVFLIIHVVIGITLIITNRKALKATIKEATRKKTKAEKKKKKIAKTKGKIRNEKRDMILFLIWTIGWAALLLGMCISMLPLLDPEANPSTYIAIGFLVLIGLFVLLGLLAFIESFFSYKREKANLKKLEES
ncbi:MAG: hypothetical protein ACFFD2_12150 [Promethearchaeota archaeon]